MVSLVGELIIASIYRLYTLYTPENKGSEVCLRMCICGRLDERKYMRTEKKETTVF